MRILSCSLTNFASYEKLDFDFTNQGLALVQGPTGAGKSTLCDAIPWVLFGKTAKGGAVDEVIPWSGETAEGEVIVEVSNGIWCRIVRTRGRAGNDLHYTAGLKTTGAFRGKDLNDTQKLINNILGLTYETYLAGAYYHEFSQTAGFFTAPAKARRALCEQLVDLSLATELQEQIKTNKSNISKMLAGVQAELKSTSQQTNFIKNMTTKRELEVVAWNNARNEKITALTSKFENFDKDRKKDIEKQQEMLTAITALISSFPNENQLLKERYEIEEKLAALAEDRCPTCGGPHERTTADELSGKHVDLTDRLHQLKILQNRIDTIVSNIARFESLANTYGEQLEEVKNENCPLAPASQLHAQLKQLETEITVLTGQEEHLTEQLTDLELLSDITNDYRAATVKRTIDELQDQTNKYLTDHFDAEIKVLFTVTDADKLDIVILKDGNECVFSQLSKGQRQLLKLCFGISVMRTVANHNGISFNALFLDEAFDGLDENLKVKAYGLLSALAVNHESIFVVEHSSELKSRFNKKYSVELVNGKSQIEEA